MKRDNSTTQRLFEQSGIAEGMSVLELGCGPGEVTELLSEIVGPSGSVLGVDRSEEVLSSARERLERIGAENVRLICADLEGAPDYLNDLEYSSFDVVTGRRVLMYLTHPGHVIAGLLPWLRQGGLVVFEEADTTICPGRVVAMPAHDKAVAWLHRMLEEEGVNRSMGFHLPATLSTAGLQFERIWAEAVIEGQGDQYSLGELLQLLSPRLESAGVATTSEVETLAAQIDIESDPSNIFVSGMRFCARARKL
ncbi:MAG: methyltransferase domain-containing protein [Thermoanaerobaculia bacterium]|nr:methyltransferase domain-containing protein [Thermoanaerobaculia bacterium]